MRAGFLQFKPEFGNVSANINWIHALLTGQDFDLIVLPELANSGYLFSSLNELKELSENIPHGDFCSSLKVIARSKDAHIISGICEKAHNGYYNSAILVYPDGRIDTYRKLHLFNEENRWFLPGDEAFKVYPINCNGNTYVLGIMVCFDWIFPEAARSLALLGAQVICHPSNLVLPYCQDAMVTRAIENRVFTITANRIGSDTNGNNSISFTGMSEIVDPKGNILYRAGKDNEEIKIIEIDPLLANDKNINSFNNLLKDRRTEFYET